MDSVIVLLIFIGIEVMYLSNKQERIAKENNNMLRALLKKQGAKEAELEKIIKGKE